MKAFWKLLRTILKLALLAALAFSAVYFWNLDQKLLDRLYALSRRARGRAEHA